MQIFPLFTADRWLVGFLHSHKSIHVVWIQSLIANWLLGNEVVECWGVFWFVFWWISFERKSGSPWLLPKKFAFGDWSSEVYDLVELGGITHTVFFFFFYSMFWLSAAEPLLPLLFYSDDLVSEKCETTLPPNWLTNLSFGFDVSESSSPLEMEDEICESVYASSSLPSSFRSVSLPFIALPPVSFIKNFVSINALWRRFPAETSDLLLREAPFIAFSMFSSLSASYWNPILNSSRSFLSMAIMTKFAYLSTEVVNLYDLLRWMLTMIK